MSYIPHQTKYSRINPANFDIDLREIVPFIDWGFFFMAWRLSGKYEGIETVHDCHSCKMELAAAISRSRQTGNRRSIEALQRCAGNASQYARREDSIC